MLAANQTILVFDKDCRKLWEAALRYPVAGGYAALDPEHAPYGLAPCAERKDALYVIDEGVLTAFDKATGQVRWRLPSVGTTGLFFDDEGMIYLNTSTASPGTIRYANQIDITRKTTSVIVKLDPRTGKGLLANAGHPFPLLLSEGRCAEIELPGLPLGQGPPRSYADVPLERLALGLAEVERDCLLVPGDDRPPERRFARLLAAPHPHRVALPRRVDLYDFGTVVPEQLAAEGASQQRAELENANTRQGAGVGTG